MQNINNTSAIYIAVVDHQEVFYNTEIINVATHPKEYSDLKLYRKHFFFAIWTHNKYSYKLVFVIIIAIMYNV